MPYASPFFQINFQGSFGATSSDVQEKWSAGLHIAKTTGGTPDVTSILAFITALATPASIYHGAIATSAGDRCYLKSITGALIGTDGKYVAGALQGTQTYTLPSPTAGYGPTSHPWPTSCCLTLRSVLLRGPASHGRVYWPATSAGINASTGVRPPADKTSAAAAAQTFLNSINTQAATSFGTGWNVALVSKVGPGVVATVTRVGIGGRLDSMESRENALPEAHTFSNLTVSTALEEEAAEKLQQAVEDELENSPAAV